MLTRLARWLKPDIVIAESDVEWPCETSGRECIGKTWNPLVIFEEVWEIVHYWTMRCSGAEVGGAIGGPSEVAGSQREVARFVASCQV
jgi:hypothetical protein